MTNKPFNDDNPDNRMEDEFEEEDFDEYEYSDEKQEAILTDVKKWTEDFSHTKHFEALTDEQKEWLDFIISAFAELLYGYELLSPKDWDVQDVDYCCLDLFPRKLSVEEAMFRSTAPVLSAFFTYLAEIGVNKRGLKLAGRVRKINDKIVQTSKNPSIWGMAKSVFAEMFTSKFDVPVSEEDLREKINQYNYNILKEKNVRQEKTGKSTKKKKKDSAKSRLKNKKKK